MEDSRADRGNLSGGGSPISSTGEPLTGGPPGVDQKPLQDIAPAALEVISVIGSADHAAGSNGSTGQSATSPTADLGLVGQVVKGVVTGITHFGAFVVLEGGQSGLIHISEIAYEYVRDVRDHLKLNETVRVKVLQVNPAIGKYDLSLKQTSEAPAAAMVAPKWRRSKSDRALPEGADPAFEEKLNKFLKTSEERLLDLRRNLEARRGGRIK